MRDEQIVLRLNQLHKVNWCAECKTLKSQCPYPGEKYPERQACDEKFSTWREKINNLEVWIMGLENYDSNELLEALALRGIDARSIEEFSRTELNNELTRRNALIQNPED